MTTPTPAWVEYWKRCVSWGDEIVWLPDAGGGIPAAWVESVNVAYVGATANTLTQSLAQARQLDRFHKEVHLMVIDTKLSEQRVIGLLRYVCGEEKRSVGFLHAGPQVIADELMRKQGLNFWDTYGAGSL